MQGLIDKYSVPFLILVMSISLLLFVVYYIMGFSEKYNAKDIVSNQSIRDDFLGDIKYRLLSLLFLIIAILCAIYLYKEKFTEAVEFYKGIIDKFRK